MFHLNRFAFHSPTQRILVRVIGTACAVIMLAACSVARLKGGDGGNQLVIPDFPSAKEQYGFATLFKDSMIPATDKKKREAQIARLAQCYGRVVESFPEDTTYTPLARLEIADGARSIGDLSRARAQYEQIIAQYPENEYVVARAQFSVGRVLDQSGQYQEAKQFYRRVHDEHGESSSGAVLDIVKRADRLYYSVHETKTKRPG